MKKIVWIIDGNEVWASKEKALEVVKKCLIDGMEQLSKGSSKKRIMEILLDEDVQLALDYWNSYAHPDDRGTGAPIKLRESEILE